MIEDKVVHFKYGQGTIIRERNQGAQLFVEFESGLRWVRINEIQKLSVPQTQIDFIVGDYVNHRTYGTGLVKQIEKHNNDFKIKVDFENVGLKFLMHSYAKLQKISKPNDNKIKPDKNKLEPVTQNIKHRRMIEAFRLGTVPYDCIHDFIFGRNQEITDITEWLKDSSQSVCSVIGDYGSGKTHMLNHTYWLAINSGYAAAYAEMDPNESPFHKPKRVYGKLIQNFKYWSPVDNQLKGFRDFMKKALGTGALKDHKYFCHLMETQMRDEESLWEWIEARESITRPMDPIKLLFDKLPPMQDSSTAINIYTYLLSALGWTAKNLLGLKGLVLLFDEAESVDMIQNRNQLIKGKDFIRALMLSAKNDTRLLDQPFGIGLIFSLSGIGKKIPFLYKNPSCLKLVYAFTPTSFVDNELFNNSSKLKLSVLSDDTLLKLFQEIKRIYEMAYQYHFNNLDKDVVFSEVRQKSNHTRLLVKGFVEKLDLMRMN